METKLLTAGEYVIPDEHTIKRDGNKVIVRPKIKTHNQVKWHCQDCRYFGRGKSSNGLFNYERSVCLLRKKQNGCYYTADPKDKACYEFEERIEPRGC